MKLTEMLERRIKKMIDEEDELGRNLRNNVPLRDKVPYGIRLGVLLLGASLLGSSLRIVYPPKIAEVRQESANAERQLECYVDVIMEHQFHSKYPEAQYRQTNSNGMDKYPEAQYRQTNSNGMDKYHAMETSFLSGRPSSDQNLVRSFGGLFLELADEGRSLRDELTKKLNVRDGGLKLNYDCK